MNGSQVAGTILWNLDIDSTKFDSAISSSKAKAQQAAKDVDKEFNKMQKSANSAFTEAVKGSQMFAVGLGVVATALATASGFGIKYAADLETMTQGFVTLLGSTEKANAAINRIQRDAAATPFEFKGLVNANMLLTSVTKNADRSEGLLLNIGKALTAAGKSGAELDRVIINLQQIANVGKITELDIRQFGFAGINILELLAEYYGTTKEAASDMVKNSKDAFKDLEGAFAKAGENGGRFAQAFTTQAGTLNQVWSNFIDNIGITASSLVKQTGLFDLAKTALKGLTDQLSFFASPAGTAQILNFLNALQQNLPIVIGIIVGGLVPAFIALAGSIAATMVPLLPFIAVGLGIGIMAKFVIDQLGGMNNAVTLLQTAFKQFGDAFNQYVKPGLDSLINEIQTQLLPALKDLSAELQPVVIPAIKLLATVLGSAVISSLKNFIENLRTAVKTTTDTVEAINKMIDFFKQLPGRVDNTKNAFMGFGDVIRDLFTGGDVTATWYQHFQTSFIGVSVLLDNIQNAFRNAFDYIIVVLTDVQNYFIQLPGKISAGLAALPAQIGTALTQAGLQVVEFIGFVTGLVIFGIPKIVDSIVAFFSALPGQLTAVWIQVYTDITTTFTNIGNWLMTTIPLIVGAVILFFWNLPGQIMAVGTAVYNAIANTFNSIWSWLSAVIPQIIATVVNWFATLPGAIGAWLNTTKETTKTGFMNIWNAIVDEISTWPGMLYEWGAKIATSFADGIRSAVGRIVDAFKDGLNKARAYVEGHSPPVAGPFKDIDKWGFNVGNAWVQGVKMAISGLRLDTPMVAGVSSYAPAQAVNNSGQGRSGPLVVVENMEVRDDSDIRDFARELAFDLELSPGFISNG